MNIFCVSSKTQTPCGSEKGLHFPEVDFFKARKGGEASWRWGSIWEGKEIRCKGALWQVGSGESASIWDDACVPGCVDNKLHRIDDGRTNLTGKVSSLIDSDCYQWELNLLHGLIFVEGIDAVSRISIMPAARSDRLCVSILIRRVFWLPNLPTFLLEIA